MLATVDDPLSPPIATPADSIGGSSFPPTIKPIQVTLRDRFTVATIVPLEQYGQLPLSLTAYLLAQLNREIEKGDTYPMTETLTIEEFIPFWFAHFAAIMLVGSWGPTTVEAHAQLSDMCTSTLLTPQTLQQTTFGQDDKGTADTFLWQQELQEQGQRHRRNQHLRHQQQPLTWQGGANWEKLCLGSFYIKPNYTGRSSHVSNGGFLVTDGARNRGVGRLMGEAYIAWAPLLGYVYSVFNLVYETNLASVRLWDSLGFKRIGRIKGCGKLAGHAGLVDALMFGRELNSNSTMPGDEDESLGEERFERIKYYLRTGKYPEGADRAEKSRLRSAATHYRLGAAPGHASEAPGSGNMITGAESSLVAVASEAPVDSEEKLFLKDKEVVPQPARQIAIAHSIHVAHGHGGINRTTAAITERYHWIRIKDTVMAVVKECKRCTETGTGAGPDSQQASHSNEPTHAFQHRRDKNASSLALDPELMVVDKQH